MADLETRGAGRDVPSSTGTPSTRAHREGSMPVGSDIMSPSGR